jgi:hypothetical protein
MSAHIVVQANHIPDGQAAAEYKAESANFMNALNASNANRAESTRRLQLVTPAIGDVGVLAASLSSAMPHSVRNTWSTPHGTRYGVQVRSEYYSGGHFTVLSCKIL